MVVCFGILFLEKKKKSKKRIKRKMIQTEEVGQLDIIEIQIQEYSKEES